MTEEAADLGNQAAQPANEVARDTLQAFPQGIHGRRAEVQHLAGQGRQRIEDPAGDAPEPADDVRPGVLSGAPDPVPGVLEEVDYLQEKIVPDPLLQVVQDVLDDITETAHLRLTDSIHVVKVQGE